MSNLPDCTGCTDPDPFDRNSDGVTHQMGTKQHPMTTPERQVATDGEIADVRVSMNEAYDGSGVGTGIDIDWMPIGLRRIDRILNRLSAAEAERSQWESACDAVRAKAQGLENELAELRKRLDEAVGLLRAVVQVFGGNCPDTRPREPHVVKEIRAFLTRHQRDNAQGEG